MDSATDTNGPKFGAAAIIVMLVLGAATVVAAQSGPASDCNGDVTVEFGSQFFGLQDNGNRLMSTSPSSIVFPLATPLLAGTHTLDGVAYDGYEQRETTSPQLQEQWFAEFLGVDGAVLATSGITEDLEDEVLEATWSGFLGEVTLAAPATAVRVVHAAPGSSSVNSVRPVCIGATRTGAASNDPVADPAAVDSASDTPTDQAAADPAATDSAVDPVATDPGAVDQAADTPTDQASPDSTATEPGATDLVVTDVAVQPAASALPSSVTVDFESTSASASVIAVRCSVLSESASGVNINLDLPSVPASDACVVEYPTDLECSIGVEPQSVASASNPGVQIIDIPVSGDANIFVGISCAEPQVAGAVQDSTTTAQDSTTTATDADAPTTTVAPAAATPTTAAPSAVVTTTTVAPAAATPTTVAPSVAGAVETAPAASAQPGVPTFTG